MDLDGRSGSYYSVLGVRRDAPVSEIRSAYRKLAMKWHPDRWGRQPWLAQEAKCRFQQIQEAYQVLSDQRKRTLYDAGLYDLQQEEEDEEEAEGFSEFVQEMLTLMTEVRREEKGCSLEELRRMLTEMARSFDKSASTQCYGREEGSGSSKRFRVETDPTARTKSRIHVSDRGCSGARVVAQ